MVYVEGTVVNMRSGNLMIRRRLHVYRYCLTVAYSTLVTTNWYAQRSRVFDKQEATSTVDYLPIYPSPEGKAMSWHCMYGVEHPVKAMFIKKVDLCMKSPQFFMTANRWLEVSNQHTIQTRVSGLLWEFPSLAWD